MWQEPAAARTARESVFRGLRGRVQAVGALTAVRALSALVGGPLSAVT